MRNRLGWAWCALTCALMAALVASCGDSEEAPTGAGAGAGAGAGEGGAAQVTPGGAGEGGAVPPEYPTLGKSCTTSAICGPGLSCLSARDDFRGTDGGPAGGLCTKECETDTECRAFARGAVCGSVAEIPLTNQYPPMTPIPRVCLLGCELGAQSGMSKCQGRVDLACRPFAAPDSEACGPGGACPGDSVCFRTRCRRLACGPRCNDNDDCEEGRYCDPVSGICSANEPDPIPWGRECDDLPFSPNCGGGSCLVTLSDSDGAGGAAPTRLKGNCTQTCTLGQACGEGTGACIRPRSEAFGAGDIGYCSPLCNCDSECVNPVDKCLPWSDAAYEEAFGSRGYCEYAEPGEQTLDCSGGASNEGGAAGHGGAR